MAFDAFVASPHFMSTPLQQSTADPLPRPTPAARRPRVLGDLGSAANGPTLVVVGGLHGNESAGVLAAERVIARFRADRREPRGRLLALTGNRAALDAGKRFIDEDLNRIWLPEYLERVRSGRDGERSEDREVAELDAAFRRALAEARGLIHLLDIHTTSGPGPAFSVLHDTLTNRAFARALPLPIALGLEEELNGTLTDHFTELGAVALSVETGQHDDPHSVDRAEAAIWIALDVAGLLPDGYAGDVEAAGRLLEAEGRGLPHAVEVRHRHGIPRGSHFHMHPGFGSFQPVTVGQPLATEEGRTVVSPMQGLLLMPLYQKLGDDGFFVTRPVRSLWLDLSTVLRRRRVERLVTWLPGVTPIPDRATTYLVNRRVARFGARQIFHLLGYRRRDHSRTHLVMEKRPEPTSHLA